MRRATHASAGGDRSTRWYCSPVARVLAWIRVERSPSSAPPRRGRPRAGTWGSSSADVLAAASNRLLVTTRVQSGVQSQGSTAASQRRHPATPMPITCCRGAEMIWRIVSPSFNCSLSAALTVGGRSSRDATGDACQRRRRSVHQVVLLTGGPGLGLDSSRAFAIVRTSAAWPPKGGDTEAFCSASPPSQSVLLSEGPAASIHCGTAQRFFDAHELVVLFHPLAACRRAGLDLAGAHADHQVRDEGIAGLAAAV